MILTSGGQEIKKVLTNSEHLAVNQDVARWIGIPPPVGKANVLGIDSGMRDGALDVTCRRQRWEHVNQSDRRLSVIETIMLEVSALVLCRCVVNRDVHLLSRWMQRVAARQVMEELML